MKHQPYNAVTPGLGGRDKKSRTSGGSKSGKSGDGVKPRSTQNSAEYGNSSTNFDSVEIIDLTEDTPQAHQPPQQSGTAPQNNQAGNQDASGSEQRWPDSLEGFVAKCFSESNRLNDNDKLIFQQQIQFLVEKAQHENKLFINDWNRQKVPILSNGSCPLELECDKKREPKKEPKQKEPKQREKKPMDRSKEPAERSPKREKRANTEYYSEERKQQRMNRFNSPDPLISSLPPKPNLPRKPEAAVASDPNYTTEGGQQLARPVVGRSQALEKRYYRLTSEPDPELVRPQHILQRAVKFLLAKLETKPYSYIKDQFKSIRQDLTVQHLKNDFCMYVYETNARIAIENNDLGEMNQCLTQLEYFFDTIVKRNSNLNRTELEFNCYRILYMLMVQNHSEIFKIKYKLLKRKYSQPDEVQKYEFVRLAFDLHKSMINGNYKDFFQQVEQFKGLPLAYKLVKDFLVEKEVIKTLNVISKSYRKLPLEFISKQLNTELPELNQFLGKYKFDSFVTNNELDCANARIHIGQLMVNTNFKRIDIKGQV